MKIFKIFRTRRRIIRVRRKPSLRSKKEYLLHKEKARELVLARLEYFNQFYSFKYGRVSIKNVRTRWGSCSSKGNLNFSYRLARIDAELLDYVVVHELCHLGEFNHSRAFWALVGKVMPDYRALRDELRALRF